MPPCPVNAPQTTRPPRQQSLQKVPLRSPDKQKDPGEEREREERQAQRQRPERD